MKSDFTPIAFSSGSESSLENDSGCSEGNWFELYEAIRNYDSDRLSVLLEREGESCSVINAHDKEGRNALHLLLVDGFMDHLNITQVISCLEILIRNGIDVNYKDASGTTPLDIAIEHGLSECISLLLDAGAHCSLEGATKLAHNAPDILLDMFDSGVGIQKKPDGGMLVKLDWSPVLQFPAGSKEQESNRSYKHEQKEMQFLYNLLDLAPETLQKYVSHPLVEAFLHLKYAKMAKRWSWLFIIAVLYPLFYAVFIWLLYFDHCKFQGFSNTTDIVKALSGEEDDDDDCECENLMSENMAGNSSCTKACCIITGPITSFAACLLAIILLFGLIEVLMFARIDIKYIMSWRNWVTRISLAIMGVTLWPGLFYRNNYDITWQYPIASMGIFLSWTMVLIHFSLYQKFSIYMEMLLRILLSVLKIILMFLPLFAGFFMGFNLMFNDMMHVFGFIMMILDSGNDVYDQLDATAKSSGIWFMGIAYSFCVVFLVVIVIVFMNFLLALSIQDVETLKGQAKLASISRKIQNLFVVDLIYRGSALIQPTQQSQGKYEYIYDPSSSDGSLPKKIRMDITLLLKKKMQEGRMKDTLLGCQNKSDK